MKIIYILGLAALMAAACCNNNVPKGLVIEKQGVFSSGGIVTDPIPGDYDPTQNWMDPQRKGTTTHVDHADLIDQPLLIIAGEIADSRYMSEEAFAKASRTADKELFIVPGATHIRTYFVEEYVQQIAAKIQQFFTDRLK